MRSQPHYAHLCSAPFYIFRFVENVHEQQQALSGFWIMSLLLQLHPGSGLQLAT